MMSSANVQRVAAEWAFIQSADTMDKAEHTVKMRLHVDAGCFVQVYVNTQKQLTGYALVLNPHPSDVTVKEASGTGIRSKRLTSTTFHPKASVQCR